jgi:hypothetical protein
MPRETHYFPRQPGSGGSSSEPALVSVLHWTLFKLRYHIFNNALFLLWLQH